MANYVLLERIELNASAASVTFNSIPQSGYTDLKIIMSARCSSANTAAAIRFNSDSSTNYSSRRLGGDNTAAYTAAPSSTSYLQWLIIPFSSSTSNTFGNAEIYVTNYLSTTSIKSVLFDSVSESNSTVKDSANMEMNVGLWSKTPEAINSITLVSGGGDFVQYSSFSLYGVASVGSTPLIAPKASGGNIATDGTYWIHTFNSTSAFVPQTTLSCEYLVVAGGGGGGANQGKGAGAGGYRSSVVGESSGGGASAESKVSLSSSTNYTITVGAGGAGGGDGSVPLCGIKGVNSSISGVDITTITSFGGGGGGAATSAANFATWDAGGKNGGSGGANTGLGTAGQGYNSGGQSGGGAGAAGGNNLTSAGGIGVASSITGSSVYRAGGGTGYENTTGTTGGGGAGSTSGTANTGGGGGPWNGTGTAGQGGSGVVIIRYAI